MACVNKSVVYCAIGVKRNVAAADHGAVRVLQPAAASKQLYRCGQPRMLPIRLVGLRTSLERTRLAKCGSNGSATGTPAKELAFLPGDDDHAPIVAGQIPNNSPTSAMTAPLSTSP